LDIGVLEKNSFIYWSDINKFKYQKFISQLCWLPSRLFLGEKFLKANIVYFKRIFFYKCSFSKHILKNHKLFFQESITIVIITTNYSFEEISKNMSQE